jgi:hypothetical protein
MTSRKFFSFFLLCALVPLVAAKVSLAMGWFSHTAVNKGYWLEHEIELLPDADSHAAAWRLVYLAPEHCTQACAQALYSLQQLYTGLGRKQLKIQPIVAAPSSPDQLGNYSAIEWAQKNFSEHELHDQIVIVNRDGLALLRYPVHSDREAMKNITKDIRADLLRLMNYDRSGT